MESMENRGAEREENKENKAETSPAISVSSQKKSGAGHWILTAVIAVCAFGGGILANHFSLDQEMRTLLNVKKRIQESYYEEVTDDEFYRVLFDAVNGELLDDYSGYMTAQEFAQTQATAKGEQSGLGLVVSTQDKDGKAQMLVSRVCGNSPAESAGVREGEKIVGFGESETALTRSESFDDFSAFLGNYSAGEPFFVELQNGSTSRVVEMEKADYIESYVVYRTNDKAYGFSGANADVLTEKGEPLSALHVDTAYIRLTQFNGNAANEFAKVMELFKTQNKKNLVLDLRGNGGGYMDILQEIASYFCKSSSEKKPVTAVADYGEKKENFQATGNYYYDYFQADSKICVLADENTASASECLIGCMSDYGALALENVCLFGEAENARTFGKGIMQSTYSLGLFSGDALKLTTAKICWPKSNRCIHGEGVTVQDGAKCAAKNPVQDEEIKAAITLLFA